MRLKNYIRRDLSKVVAPEKINALERAWISTRGNEMMQDIFRDLIQTIEFQKEKIEYLVERKEVLDEAVKKQQNTIKSYTSLFDEMSWDQSV